MRWTYDTSDQSLYVYLTDASAVSQIEMDDGTLVDVGPAGEVVGIEVLRAWAEWDLRAIVERFNLPVETAGVLAWIAYAPIARYRPPLGKKELDGLAVPAEVDSAQNLGAPDFAMTA